MTDWDKIHEARRMQNVEVCICRHERRDHLDETGDCTHKSVQYSPVEQRNVDVVCVCVQFR